MLLTGDVDNANGTIAAYNGGDSNGSTIQLANITIGSGTLIVGNSTTGDTTDALFVGGGDTATLIGVIVQNSGTITATSDGTLTLDGVTLTNNGSLQANDGTVFVDNTSSVSGSGDVVITGGGLADFAGTFDQNVIFLDNPGILELGQSVNYHATVSGYSSAAMLDLSDISFINGTTSVTDDSNGPGSDELIVTDGTHTANISVASSSPYPTNWAVVSDGSGGTFVVDPDIVVASNDSNSATGTQTVLFAGRTGTLNIASTFTGEIVGFTGTAPDAAHSDVIDLAGFDWQDTSVSASSANGLTTLTATDLSGDGLSASLTLVGNLFDRQFCRR